MDDIIKTHRTHLARSRRVLVVSDGARHRGLRRAAFTLIEILLVVAIAAILLSATTVSLHISPAQYRLYAAAGDLTDSLALIRARAILRRRVHYLFLDLDEQYYWFRERTEEEEAQNILDMDPGDLRVQRLPYKVRIKDIAKSAEETVEHGRIIVHAYPSGRMNQFMAHLAMGDGERERELSIEINPLTGKAHVTQGYAQYQGLLMEDGPP